MHDISRPFCVWDPFLVVPFSYKGDGFPHLRLPNLEHRHIRQVLYTTLLPSRATPSEPLLIAANLFVIRIPAILQL